MIRSLWFPISGHNLDPIINIVVTLPFLRLKNMRITWTPLLLSLETLNGRSTLLFSFTRYLLLVLGNWSLVLILFNCLLKLLTKVAVRTRIVVVPILPRKIALSPWMSGPLFPTLIIRVKAILVLRRNAFTGVQMLVLVKYLLIKGRCLDRKLTIRGTSGTVFLRRLAFGRFTWKR